ncbi:MAG: mannose-6-phosphate isomerase [Flavobacteriaceae bacterium]
MNKDQLKYPIKFTPILKEKIWGGNKLNLLFNKSAKNNIGESWEISDVDSNISIVDNGLLKGKSLAQLIFFFKEDLIGASVYKAFGNNFPLLFKFIDAKKDLSVQLHPNDKLAKERHNSFGKAEMWYVLDTDEDAKLILGFNTLIDQNVYQKHLSENTLSEILQYEKIKKGDSFFIETGTVHAIGAGVVLAEIQQTSDITYRIFDYNRPGLDGKLRELHTDLAIDAINFENIQAKLEYKDEINIPVNLCKSKYFHTNKLSISNLIKRDLSLIDSFVVYMCLEGDGEIIANNYSEIFTKGDTLLIPAIIKNIKIKTQSAIFLEVYIP